jgi:hypothetical protein
VAQTDKDGAFEAKLFAPGGSSVLVKVDPTGNGFRDALEGKNDRLDLIGTVGTVCRSPIPADRMFRRP